MRKRIVKPVLATCLFFYSICLLGQSVSCPNHLFYYSGSNGFIAGYDPALPISPTNPVNTGTPNPPGGALALLPNINGGTLSPTFYGTMNVPGTVVYIYWDGANWVNTGHQTGSFNAVNIGGCGSYIYNFAGPTPYSVYIYDGTGNGSLLMTIPTGTPCVDIVADCDCNFYILDASTSNKTLTKYSPTGVVLTTYTLTGLPNLVAGVGFAIMGNDIYYPYNSLLYSGTIGAGSVINFSSIPFTPPGGGSIGDFASCPNAGVYSIAGNSTLTASGPVCPLPVLPPTLTASTSGGAVTYSWSGPGIVGPVNVPTVTVNTAGVYTCNLVTLAGCPQGRATLTIAVNAGPCVSVSSSISCAALGSATVTAAGPGPFSFTWQPTAQTGSTVAGLSPGIYIVQVLDVGTGSTFTNVISLVPSIPLSGGLNASSVVCVSATNGTANITNLSGGSGLSFYIWSNGVTTYTVSNPTNLSAGNWTVTLTDVLTGCAFTETFTIGQPNGPLVVISPTNSSICLNTNSIALFASGSGTLFSWTPTLGLTSTNTPSTSASPLSTTVYTVTGTLGDCSAVATATVNVLPPPSLNINLSSTSVCAQALNGSPNTIVLNAGGAITYTISTPNEFVNSNPAGPSSSLSLLPPFQPTGAATATLFGSNGACTVSTTAAFTIIPNPTVSISNPSPAICAGQSYTYTSSGASSFTWSAASPGSTLYSTGNIAVTNASINSVFSVVGGSLGCYSAVQNSTLIINPIPTLTVNPNPALVCKNSSTMLVASGTGTSYTWSPGFFLNTTGSATVIANPPAQQSYQVVSSLNNCSVAAIVTVSVMTLPIAQITTTKTVFCINSPISLQGSGGLNYIWDGPGNFNATGQNVTFNAFSNSYSGIYTLTVIDQNGCKGQTTQYFTVLNLPTGGFSGQGRSGCAPFMANLRFEVNSFSTPAVAMSWQVNGQFFSGNQFNYYAAAPGNYPIYGSVTDVNGCINTFTDVITAWPKPEANFYFVPEYPVEKFDEVLFTSTSKGATVFNWYFDKDIARLGLNNITHIFDTMGTYPVTLVASNQWQCSDTVIKPVAVVPDQAIYIPNAFTPNNDGVNDLFGPVLRGATGFSFAVFDRWGEKIFETRNLKSSWDGTFKGQPCKEEIYVWKLMVRFGNLAGTKERNLAGEVLLYR